MANTHRVKAISLNLRSEPVVQPSTVIAVLPQGQDVKKVSDSTLSGWWIIATTLNGQTVSGHVNASYLEPISTPVPTVLGIKPVHLKPASPILRASRSGRAFPLNEQGQPTRPGGTPDAAALGRIIRWLAVETSDRYEPTSTATYCNIYAYDYCYLAGVYFPRVWWTSQAIAKLLQGQDVPVQYGTTVREMNANMICDWFEDYGDDFGWRRTFDLNVLQQAANAGKVGIIIVQRVDLNRSGHVVAVVPETDTHKAHRIEGVVKAPLQSQAGSTNRQYWTYANRAWWRDTKFRKFGFWIHD